MPSSSNLRSSRWASQTTAPSFTPKYELPAFLRDALPQSQSQQQPPSPPPSHDAPADSVSRDSLRSAIPQGQALPLTTAPRAQLTAHQKQLLARHQTFSKFVKLLRRLKWKAQTLLFCHHTALGYIHAAQQQRQQQNAASHSVLDPDGHGNDNGGAAGAAGAAALPYYHMDSHEARTMFKIDFFEFYVLLERVLVHLLGVFAIRVSAVYAGDVKEVESDGARAQSISGYSVGGVTGGMTAPSLVGNSRAFKGHAHSFHANVLSALDAADCPLREVLGQGEVRDYLGMAKEFRNRWKDVDEDEEGNEDERVDGLVVGSRYERLMRDLRLEEMLACIVQAVELGKGIAEEELRRVDGEAGMERGGIEEMMDMDLDDASIDAVRVDDGRGEMPWEAMPDAMEWD